MRIDNNSNPDGLKILMITDSYASPLGTWFAPMCSRLDFYWANNNSAEDIKRYVDEGDYDLVIFGLYPNDVNSDFIHFYTEEN